MEIPRLHLDGVDAKIGHMDIARAYRFRRLLAWIGPAPRCGPDRRGRSATESWFPFHGRSPARPKQIRSPLCDQVNDFALALDATSLGDHAR